MDREKPFVLSIAGFDPSGGAGILADIKTFEMHKVCGMGVVSAITFQNDVAFEAVKWVSLTDILTQIKVLQRRFCFSFVKIGLIQDLEVLQEVVYFLKSTLSNIHIIFDPIIKATAGYQFHHALDLDKLYEILKNVFLITPNVQEAQYITCSSEPMQAAQMLSQCCNVLLKGGHAEQENGIDYLFLKNQPNPHRIEKQITGQTHFYPKHGSGCVLSASIAANLAQQKDLITACQNAKHYIEKYLISHTSLLGMHYVS